MADNATTFKIKAIVEGKENVAQLKNSIRGLDNRAKQSSAAIAELRTKALQLGQASDRTENELRQSITVLTDLRANVALTSKRYQLLTRDINRAEAALAKSGSSGKGASGRFGRTARTLGAVAGAGVFGGPEGFIGAGIGGIVGGPTAALAGGAIGAQVSQVRKAIGETTSYSAALALQRKALRLVIADTEKYNKAQTFLQKTSKKLAIPQDVITRQFTQLTASVKGAGRSIEEAQAVFLSIASGIRGTGGSLEDMKSAMTAVSQVFSKGKVSAEELRQQLGERLPGAFTIFAESMELTPAELDKALEQGKVTLQDFITFSETLLKKYENNAKILAAGPEAAGDRLQTAMASLRDNVGVLLQPVGANFQDTFTKIIEQIDGAAKALRNFYKLGEENLEARLADVKEDLQREIERADDLRESIKTAPTFFRAFGGMNKKSLENMLDASKAKIEELKKTISELEVKINDVKTATEGASETTKTKLTEMQKAWGGVKDGVQEYVNGLGTVAEEMKNAVGNALKGLEDQLVNFVTTGKLAFKDLARSILADMARIVIRQQSLKPILGAIFPGTPVTPQALGGVFAQNGIQKFARGGVVDKPTIFPFKNGTGLMGEAGPEAILPLRRGKGGRLGVESSGGGTSVVVNVDASGSDVQGDEDAGRQLGQLIAIAVQGQLIEQSRPGGLLNQS